ncbi:MAG TPA: tRNA dihydrouridine synthase DusB [Thermodesulfobacteriota bacterium]
MQIGSLTLENNLVLSPMAGVTDLVYRQLAREQGCALALTEMVSAAGLTRGSGKSFALMRKHWAERPLGVQLFGGVPSELAEAARIAEAEGADLIDVNFGCPVKKVTRYGAGSALLREPLKVAEILRTIRAAIRIPLTLKIRMGWDATSRNYREIGRIAEAEGAAAITMHGRTVKQMYTGQADWDAIADLKQTVRIPVLGSGDLFSADAIVRMLRHTGADGAFVARGSMGNPWIFAETLAKLGRRGPFRPPTAAELRRHVHRHYDLQVEVFGETRAVREMRKHLAWYTKGLPDGGEFRNTVNRLDRADAVRDAIDRFFDRVERIKGDEPLPRGGGSEQDRCDAPAVCAV